MPSSAPSSALTRAPAAAAPTVGFAEVHATLEWIAQFVHATAADSDVDVATLQRMGAGLAELVAQVAEPQRVQVRNACVTHLLALVAEAAVPSQMAACLATRVGSLLENASDADDGWRRLAHAVVPPVLKALEEAAHFVDAAHDMPASDARDTRAVVVGGRRITQAAADALRRARPSGYAALVALDLWYLPAVAAWSRCPQLLAQLQKNERLLHLFRHHEWAACVGPSWLQSLLGTPLAQPCILYIPELDEVHRLCVTGVVYVGQFAILLAARLRPQFRRLGLARAPTTTMVKVMSGRGPQKLEDVEWTVRFHLYPVPAIDPVSGHPIPGADVLPTHHRLGLLPTVTGHIVFVLIGPRWRDPKQPHGRYPMTRQFHGLAADIGPVVRLEGEDAAEWNDRFWPDRAWTAPATPPILRERFY